MSEPRFKPAQLIGMGININAQEPVYFVKHQQKNLIFTVCLDTGIDHTFDENDPKDNTGCFNEFGTFAELKEKLASE